MWSASSSHAHRKDEVPPSPGVVPMNPESIFNPSSCLITVNDDTDLLTTV